MPSENAAPAQAESAAPVAAPQSMDFEASARSALAEFEKGESGNADAGQGETAPEGKAGESSTAPVEEPEHVKWAKSVSGNVDDQGNLNVDRVLKQAYELNRQNQLTAQQLAQLKTVLQHPGVLKALEEATKGKPPEAEKPAPDAEKSEIDILNDHIDERITAATKDLTERNQLLFQDLVETKLNLTYAKLCEEFGKTDYDGIRDQIGQQIHAVAQRANTTPQALIEFMIRNGSLYDTFASAARNILYPRLKEQRASAAAAAEQKSVEGKRNLKAMPSGTSSKSVAKPKAIETFDDAVRAAEEELAQNKK